MNNILDVFDSIVSEELSRVSHIQYDSHAICKHFASKLKERLIATPAPATSRGNYPPLPIPAASSAALGRGGEDVSYFTDDQMRAYADSARIDSGIVPTVIQPVEPTDEQIDAVFRKFAGSNQNGTPWLTAYSNNFHIIVRELFTLARSQAMAAPAPAASEVHRAWALLKNQRADEAYAVLSVLVGWDHVNAVPFTSPSTPEPAAASGAVTKEFTNELGNAIRITIEGPVSTSENILTPMEAGKLREALNEHAPTSGGESVDAEDAARYRWVRISGVGRAGVYIDGWKDGEELDAAIDAALQATPPQDGKGEVVKCTCVYATEDNTESVRKGFEMAGYVISSAGCKVPGHDED